MERGLVVKRRETKISEISSVDIYPEGQGKNPKVGLRVNI